jgi:hypothetical protein
MNTNRTHPSPGQLAAFDAGLLPPDDREATERHVSECPDCCRFLERLPEDAMAARIRVLAGGSTAGASETPHTGRDATPLPGELPEGLRDPRYRVLGTLGTGGMGTVYRAVQINLDRVVALKVLHRRLTDQPGFVDRFRTEVKALARLNHPNVVAAYDADGAADLQFLVMEFVEGESLETLVARRGPLPVGEACALICRTAEGLQHAHEHGLVHRDIKPANLLLNPAGVVKIADFGLAQLAEIAEPSASGCGAGEPAGGPHCKSGSAPVVLGTPEYMAPEQACEPHRTDIRSDLYSLGCTFYFLLSGHPPFFGVSRLQTLLDHQDATPPDIAGLPPDLAAIINRLLAKEPDKRFSTPAELVGALGLVVGTGGTIAPPPPAPRRNRWRFAVAAGLVAAAIVCGVIALHPRDRLAEPSLPVPSPEPAPNPSGLAEGTSAPALELAPPPRLVNRSPLASADQLAALQKQAREQVVDWVRMNNRWRPDADIAVKTAAQMETAPTNADRFVLMFGGGLLKSEKPTLVSTRTGDFFVFELTPEQAQAAALGLRDHKFTSYSHTIEPRRATPSVRLSGLRIDDADSHTPEARLDGRITCVFPSAPGASEYLLLTHYKPNGARVVSEHHPNQVLTAGRTTLQFSAKPLEQPTDKGQPLVLVFAEWVSENGTSRVIESNTAAALVRIVELTE